MEADHPATLLSGISFAFSPSNCIATNSFGCAWTVSYTPVTTGAHTDTLVFVVEGYFNGFLLNSRFYNLDLSGTTRLGTVPLPPALALFGTGLALIGLLSWRRKKHVA